MQATHDSVHNATSQDEPQSEPEPTRIQRTQKPRTLPVAELEYHLFVPDKAYDPLLESAYEVWRDVWQQTLEELDGATQVHSDEFLRQSEVGVLAVRGRCIAVTGLRWLDLSLARAREDSYFQHWPKDAMAALGHRVVGVASNTAVHPEWRGALIEPPRGQPGEPSRLAFTTIALSVRRVVASWADSLIALTRNDRSIDRVAAALGATRLGQIQVHGIDTDVICIERRNAVPESPIVKDLWGRRHQP